MAIIYRTDPKLRPNQRVKLAVGSLRRKMANALTEAVQFGRRELVTTNLVSVNTNVLRGSIQTRVDRVRLVGRVFTPIKYGGPVNEGRRSGRRPPPIGAIELWAKRKRIQPNEAKGVRDLKSLAFVIARKIGIKGIPGQKFLQKVAILITKKLPSIVRRHVGR